jgi:hypothetical protein
MEGFITVLCLSTKALLKQLAVTQPLVNWHKFIANEAWKGMGVRPRYNTVGQVTLEETPTDQSLGASQVVWIDRVWKKDAHTACSIASRLPA